MNLSAKKKRIAVIAVAAAAAIALLVALTVGNQGFLDMYRAYRQDKELTQKIEGARAEADSLRAEIERLKGDTAYIEKVAREKLGMARKDEKIIKFVEEK
ncbi:MAG: septum formation initiator family protein [Chitinispirillales bacterium]|nr:septum formation initiator family protein [Chitinispirillales bacterium]